MYFWSYALPETWLDNCLKIAISEDPLTGNIVNAPKHCWNLIESDFSIIIDHCDNDSVGKSLS